MKRGKGGARKSTATIAVDTVKECATDLGVPERTARDRMASADAFDALPKPVQAEVAAQEKPLAVPLSQFPKCPVGLEQRATATTGGQ